MVIYCERFLELLIDLEGQLPTRRYLNTLLQDLHVLPLIKMSPTYKLEENGLMRDLFSLLRHFVNFSVNDHSGAQYTRNESYDAHYAELAQLQRTALKHFKSKLTLLALSNHGAIEQRSGLEAHLDQLTDLELTKLCTALGLRTTYPDLAGIEVSRVLLLEVLLSLHERRKTFQEVVRDLSVLPTEVCLFHRLM